MAEVRTTGKSKQNTLDVSALVLIAVLLAAGFILNLTVGKALAATGIQPEFIIASYCLAILLIRPSALESILIGVLAATVIQLTTSIPFLEYAADIPASLAMGTMVLALAKDKEQLGVIPAITTFICTLISGGIFASIAAFFIFNLGLTGFFLTMGPVVLGTAIANAIVVQALYTPLRLALKRGRGGNLA